MYGKKCYLLQLESSLKIVWSKVCKLACMNYEGLFCIGDAVCGMSVRIRNSDDVIQIWNNDSSLAEKSTVRHCHHQGLI